MNGPNSEFKILTELLREESQLVERVEDSKRRGDSDLELVDHVEAGGGRLSHKLILLGKMHLQYTTTHAPHRLNAYLLGGRSESSNGGDGGGKNGKLHGRNWFSWKMMVYFRRCV